MHTNSSATGRNRCSRCSETTIATPSSFKRAKILTSASEPAASRLDVGSSSTRILGRHAMAAASATRCFCPLDSSVSLSGRSLPTPQSSATMRTRATVAFGAAPLFSSEKAISSATIPMKNWLLGSCITTPMPSVRCRGERSSTSAPSTRTAPSRSPGKKVPASPSIRRRTVDLPSPDLPQRTVHEPYATSSDTPQTRPPAPDDARSCPASSDPSR